MIQLGYMYEHGEGPLEENAAEAVRLYTLSAKLGNYEAQTNLGILHMKGCSVTRDLNLAASWFQEAAEQGHEKVRQLRQHLGPFVTRFPAPPYPTRAVCCAFVDARADRALIGALNPMSWPIWGFRRS